MRLLFYVNRMCTHTHVIHIEIHIRCTRNNFAQSIQFLRPEYCIVESYNLVNVNDCYTIILYQSD